MSCTGRPIYVYITRKMVDRVKFSVGEILLAKNIEGLLFILMPICYQFVTEEYQLDMMRRLRRVNVDHSHVGWYQSSDVGSFLNLPLLESQYHYQTSIEESVVLIYGK